MNCKQIDRSAQDLVNHETQLRRQQIEKLHHAATKTASQAEIATVMLGLPLRGR